ncbi:DUF2058 domain-containing protein [Neptuniibacter sp. CAU 1671]|uniref:DUF2058 domain-containing protein n=1 Tax=Neptuniibacter sp. CAU 1671 TaxID=3032593 RepID=UPI0023D98FD4|nr:DUF2058 domain-containing protein [Neptuniibacter sp. CAU 1671]MDF2180901.1 DUF2058 domain-containing protein [Neptuniibacter sp. CAU 1671]
MAGSLKDQLLKAGLADQKKAKQIDTEKRKQKKQQTKARKSGLALDNQHADLQAKLQQEREEKREKDRLLNQQREAEKREREITAQCRQMIQQQQVVVPDNAEVGYNFVYDKKIKKIYVTDTLQQQLSRGQLAIGVLDEKFYLVPDKFADKIEQRRPEMVIRIEAEETDEDDPYADFKIPDDLMW